ncbi:MAG: hypothetical protein WCI45_00180 [Desulfuromonadales bacterium]
MANRTLGEIIQGIKKQKDLNGKQFVALLGIGASTLVDYEKDKKKPGWESLCALRRIGVSIDSVIDESEGVVSEPSTPYQPDVLCADERDLLKAYRSLNESDKGCALRMVAGLKGLEDQSETSGITESSCKVMNFG